jgi:hypothetical protein
VAVAEDANNDTTGGMAGAGAQATGEGAAGIR